MVVRSRLVGSMISITFPSVEVPLKPLFVRAVEKNELIWKLGGGVNENEMMRKAKSESPSFMIPILLCSVDSGVLFRLEWRIFIPSLLPCLFLLPLLGLCFFLGRG